MPRYRLTIEYDGRPYRGFQAQAALPSVQASIEKAVLGFSGETTRIHAAGRTDTGVHATGQVIHVDLSKAWPTDVVRDALNVLTSEEIYTEKKFKAGQAAVDELNEAFKPYGLVCENITLGDHRFHPKYQEAIVNKKVFDQPPSTALGGRDRFVG